MNEWSEAEHHVERAHEAYEAGRWEDAARALRQALALNPYKPEWHFNLGLTLEQAGKYAEAAEAFAECHELDGDDPQVLLAAGVNLLRADDVKGAIAWLERAEKADPAASASWVHRIEAYARLGDHEQAEVMFYMAQQVNAKDAGALANLAESLLMRGKTDKALWCLKEAQQLEPNLPKINARLGEAYALTGRFEKARQLYLRELRNDPGDIDTLLDLGGLLADMGRFPEAEDKFQRVLEIEPENAAALTGLSEVAARQGQSDAAVAGLERVLEIDPEVPGVRRVLAERLLARGRSEDIEAARQHLAREHADVMSGATSRRTREEKVALGRVLLDAEMAKQACEMLSAACAEGEGGRGALDAEAWHLFSVALLHIGERSAGVRAGRRAIKCDATAGLKVRVVHNLVVAHALSGEWKRAGYWVRRGLKTEPANAELRRLRVKVWVRQVVRRVFGWMG